MCLDRGYTTHAAATFGTAGALISIVMATAYYTATPPVGSLRFYFLLVLFSVVLSTFIGGLWWKLLVEGTRWGSTSIRGAVTGLLTGWLSVVLLIPIMSFLGQPAPLSISRESIVQEFAGVILASVLAATFYFGPFATFPIGIVVGYMLGRRYPDAT